jgi:ferredoxin
MAAETISDQLKAQGWETVLNKIDKNTFPKEEQAELNFFLFPVFATAVPQIMLNYFKKMKKCSEPQKAVIICTIGRVDLADSIPGHEGQALLEAEKILKKKNYLVTYQESVSYPANLSLILKQKNDEISLMLKQGNDRVRSICKEIIDGKQFKKAYKFKALMIFFCALFGMLYKLMGRRFIGKLYVAGKVCNACGLCEESCPAKVIKIRTKIPGWNYSCEGCMRCVGICPQSAIGFSIWKLVITLVSLFVPFIWIYPLIAKTANFHSIIIIFVWLVCHLCGLVIMEGLVSLLERLPLINKLFRIKLSASKKQYYARIV